MSEGSPQDLVVVIDTLDQLFNAPDVNPFSENRLDILGMSGLEYIVRQLQAHRRDWKHVRLRIRVPQEAITPGFELRLTEAVRRYCRAKIEDNRIGIHLIRSRSSVGLGLLMVIVLALILGFYLLFTYLLPDAPQAVQLVVAATISLFAWVSLWDPLEALIFNPIALMRENYVLKKLSELEIMVESTTPSGATSSAANSPPFDAGAPATSQPSI